MKHSIHRIIGSLLLICFCIGVLSFFYLDLKQLGCKVVAQVHILNKEQLVILKVPVSEFTKNQDEISFRGSLYDVNSYEIDGDTAIVSVWHDENEEIVQHSIVASFETTVQCSNSKQSKQFSQYKPYIPDGKVLCRQTCLNLTYEVVISEKIANYTPQLFSCMLADVITPPPNGSLELHTA